MQHWLRQAKSPLQKLLLGAFCLGLAMAEASPPSPVHAQAAAVDVVLDRAKAHLGAPYRFGGESPSGFDSSGYVQYVYGQAGIPLPRRVTQQFAVGTPVERSELLPGDLVFFGRPGSGRQPTLAGIFLQEGRFLAAASAYGGVAARNLDTPYYRENFLGGRRVLTPPADSDETTDPSRDRITIPAPENEEEPAGEVSNPESALGGRIAAEALRLLGSPYRYGGESPSGFDTSGFVQYVYAQAGIDLPRRVAQQVEVGDPVDKTALEAGDLLFFGKPNSDGRPTLVGIYLGEQEFVAAASAYGGVAVRSLQSAYYESNFLTARRIAGASSEPATSQPPSKPAPQPAPVKEKEESQDPAPSSIAEEIIAEAKEWMGYPYRLGADGPEDGAFDCSSFTQYVFGKAGISLPRTSRSQAKEGTSVSTSRLQPGDLLFFDASSSLRSPGEVDHVGIYIGDGQFIHTYKKGIGVTVTSLSGFWKRQLLFARRVL